MSSQSFLYKAFNSEGVLVAGTIQAGSESEVVRQLKSKRLIAVLVEEARISGAGATKRASQKDILLAMHELCTLLESGVSISEAIESQVAADYPGQLLTVFHSISADLIDGKSFSEAMIASKLRLPDYVFQLVRAGEMTGNLAQSFREGLNQFEYELKLAGEFKSALIYPAILVFSGLAAVILIFVVVVPKFASLVDKVDDLPFLADIVLRGGVWFNSNIWLLVVASILAVMTFSFLLRDPGFRQRAFDIFAKAPLIDRWIAETDTAKWASIMAALLKSKVDILKALELAAVGVKTTSRKARLADVANSVVGGKSLAQSLEEASVLTASGYNLVRVGEKSGRLPEMMYSLARLYDDAGRNRMKTLLVLIEPIAILLIGGVIGVIILGVILAITSVNDVSF